MDYYDESYDFYDAYEDWGDEDYEGYDYNDYDEYGNEDEHWYDAEEGFYHGYDEEEGYGEEMYDESYDEGYGHMGGAHDYSHMDHGYEHMDDGYEQMNEHQGGYDEYEQEGQDWQNSWTTDASSYMQEADEDRMTGIQRGAVHMRYQPHDAVDHEMSMGNFNQSISPVRQATPSQSHRSFLPNAYLNPYQIQTQRPSRALSINRSRHLTVEPAVSSPRHSPSPTAGMFRDLFWKGTNRAATGYDRPRSPRMLGGYMTPLSSGLPTPRSADGKTSRLHTDAQGRGAIGFLAPLTP